MTGQPATNGSHPRWTVGIACSRTTEELYLGQVDRHRLAAFADVVVKNFDVVAPSMDHTPYVAAVEDEFADFVSGLDILLVCHGSPRVTERVLATAPRLLAIGELEGDRFASRIDVAAARRQEVLVVDSTHSSSWPVAEWALGLALLGLREHARFRDIIAGHEMDHSDYRTSAPARELTGRRVGLIGFGHIAWRLRELLTPFRVELCAHDPYAPRELADALDIDFVGLRRVMEQDVVICLAPETAETRGMIGAEQLSWLQPEAVFVNVSRGSIVQTPALIDKASRGDAWFCLDAHDPEPIAVDSPLRAMRNVFLSPHIGGMTREAQPRFFSLMVDELERIHRGHEPRAQLTSRVLAGRTGV